MRSEKEGGRRGEVNSGSLLQLMVEGMKEGGRERGGVQVSMRGEGGGGGGGGGGYGLGQ